jgi:hypothetical protein
MLTENDVEDQKKLVQYFKKYLSVICDKFTGKQVVEVEISSLIDLLSLITSKFKSDDFLKKVTHEFL